MSWDEFLALKRAGFRPPKGPGRCGWCGFRKPTQGHRGGCPQTPNNRTAAPAKTRSDLVKSGVAEGATNTTRPLTHPLGTSKRGG